MKYVLGQRIRRGRERVYQPRQTYLSLSEEECRRKLRLTHQAVTDVCHLLADELGTDAPCPVAFPVAVKVTVALHFNASGSFQLPLRSIGGISQSAINSAIHAVTSGLVRHAGEYIQFLVTPDSQERAKQAFWVKYGFPGVLGAIDYTHVQLRAPSENALIYINRKGTHSIDILTRVLNTNIDRQLKEEQGELNTQTDEHKTGDANDDDDEQVGNEGVRSGVETRRILGTVVKTGR
ncbi:unnamed protein product [Leuciscus chuanchicus]